MTEPTREPSAPYKLTTRDYVIGGGVLVAIVALCTFLSVRSSGGDQGQQAQAACQELVKDRLRAPASAEFSDLDRSGSGGHYVVTGAVDSENAFGAMIRNTFTCEVRLDGDVWRLVDMDGLTS